MTPASVDVQPASAPAPGAAMASAGGHAGGAKGKPRRQEAFEELMAAASSQVAVAVQTPVAPAVAPVLAVGVPLATAAGTEAVPTVGTHTPAGEPAVGTVPEMVAAPDVVVPLPAMAPPTMQQPQQTQGRAEEHAPAAPKPSAAASTSVPMPVSELPVAVAKPGVAAQLPVMQQHAQQEQPVRDGGGPASAPVAAGARAAGDAVARPGGSPAPAAPRVTTAPPPAPPKAQQASGPSPTADSAPVQPVVATTAQLPAVPASATVVEQGEQAPTELAAAAADSPKPAAPRRPGWAPAVPGAPRMVDPGRESGLRPAPTAPASADAGPAPHDATPPVPLTTAVQPTTTVPPTTAVQPTTTVPPTTAVQPTTTVPPSGVQPMSTPPPTTAQQAPRAPQPSNPPQPAVSADPAASAQPAQPATRTQPAIRVQSQPVAGVPQPPLVTAGAGRPDVPVLRVTDAPTGHRLAGRQPLVPAQRVEQFAAAVTPLTAQSPAPAPTAVPMTAGAAGQSVADALPAIAAQQVVAAVVPLHRGPDGSYRVSLRLHPEELGNVAVTVEVSKGTVSLHMRAEAPATTSVLGDAMPQLRAQLEAQGLQTGSLVVADYSGGSAGGWAGREHPLTGQWATPAGTPGFSEPDPAPTAHDTPTPQRRDGGLDLHL